MSGAFTLSAHAVAIRRDHGTLALFLRVARSRSGIYVVFAAGQERPGHDPHSSWHRDGRVHHKSFKGEFMRRRRQPLDASFTGTEPFITTSTTRASAPLLPDCQPGQFSSVIEVPAQALGDAPSGTQVDVQLVGPNTEPTAPTFEHVLLQRAVIADGQPYGQPAIAVFVYNVLLTR
jgi:hypothetical protein